MALAVHLPETSSSKGQGAKQGPRRFEAPRETEEDTVQVQLGEGEVGREVTHLLDLVVGVVGFLGRGREELGMEVLKEGQA